MHTGKQLSTEIDATVPTAARMYDYYLGGKDNYSADRAAVEELDKVVPSTRRLALNNRRFLQRVVRTLTQEYGIRQYLDHGSGLPTQDNVHQVAQRIDPTTHVVYVDNDPMVLVHGRALLEQDERTVVIQADMRDTDGPLAVANRVRERLAPGSFMVMCQLVSEDEKVRKFVTDFMDQATQGHWGRVRRQKDVEALFEGLEILEPGLVEVSTWRPDTEVAPRQLTQEWIEFGGVGRLPS